MKWLIKYCPKFDLSAINIEILNTEPDSNYAKWVKEEYTEFELGTDSILFDCYKCRNNKFMKVIESDNVKDAIIEFFCGLKTNEYKEISYSKGGR